MMFFHCYSFSHAEKGGSDSGVEGCSIFYLHRKVGGFCLIKKYRGRRITILIYFPIRNSFTRRALFLGPNSSPAMHRVLIHESRSPRRFRFGRNFSPSLRFCPRRRGVNLPELGGENPQISRRDNAEMDN